MIPETPSGIFDMHTHIFPQKIAEKAVSAIGDFYKLEMHKKGYSEDLIEAGGSCGVKHFLVCSTATTPLQVTAINSFIAGEAERHPEFIGFGSLHPDYEDIEGETERIIALGLKGIKLHPDFQKFALDDAGAFGIYEACGERLPLLVHTGDSRYSFSNPFRILRVLENFPKLRIICAHLGGYSEWREVCELPGYLGNPNIFIDTSSAIQFMEPEKAADIIRKHGADRVFWGSDYPMWAPEKELENFMKIPLTDDEREKILYKNAGLFLEAGLKKEKL